MYLHTTCPQLSEASRSSKTGGPWTKDRALQLRVKVEDAPVLKSRQKMALFH